MLTSLMPFHTFQHTEISYKVIQGERPGMPCNAEELGISHDLWQLLVRCWHAESTRRPPIEEVLQHLSNGPAREMVFPPSKIPSAPSCESVFESDTHKYGNGSQFTLPSLCAYSCTGEVFVTANPLTPIEGMLGVSW